MFVSLKGNSQKCLSNVLCYLHLKQQWKDDDVPDPHRNKRRRAWAWARLCDRVSLFERFA